MEELKSETENFLQLVASLEDSWKLECAAALETLDNFFIKANKTPQQNKKKPKKLSVINDSEFEENASYADNSEVSEDLTKHGRPVRQAKLKTQNSFKEPSLNKKLRQKSISETSISKRNITIGKENESPRKKSNQSKRKLSQENLSNSKDFVEENSKKIDESIVLVSNNDDPIVVLSDEETFKMPPPSVVPKKKKNPKNKTRSGNKSNVEVAAAIKIEKRSLEDNNTVSIENPTNINVENSEKEPISKEIKQEMINNESSAKRTTRATTRTKKGLKHKPMKEEKKSIEKENGNIVEENSNNNTNKTKSAENVTPEITDAAAVAATPTATIGNRKTSIESIYEDAIANVAATESKKTSLNLIKDLKINTNSIVRIEKLKLVENNVVENVVEKKPADDENENLEKSDATFVSSKNIEIPETNTQNDTFVTTKTTTTTTAASLQSTFIVDNNNQEFNNCTFTTTTATTKEQDIVSTMKNVVLQHNNETFSMNSTQTIVRNDINDDQQEENSLITDDDSSMEEEQEEDFITPPIPQQHQQQQQQPQKKPSRLIQPKMKNELFNPFEQSPVKKKVEAFEKHANSVTAAAGSPIVQRQTRTKTRAAKENQEPDKVPVSNNNNTNNNTAIKSTTPLLGRQISRLLTPTQTNLTPLIGGILQKKLPSSASKLGAIPKSIKSTFPQKSQSLSRDSSTEDLRVNKLQQITDEKRRKREQKQHMAAQIREAREKERTEKLKRIMHEREERAQRKALEAAAQQKWQLEEINRNLKLQEEKREQQKRHEKQKQLDLESAEMLRKEREMYENMKIQKAKEALQQKLLNNQKLLQQQKSKRTPKYDFDMLNSDDSTDDEDRPSTKRPLPPAWCKSSHRQLLIERQTYVDTNVIDSFFSVQPMTPNLKEIFPSIDPKYLKRNSSVVWNTPPRYSELPKY